MKYSSMRAEIRHIVDVSGGRMTASEILSILKRRTTPDNFAVTINQMVDAKQLTKRKVKGRGKGVRFAYGPGPVAVDVAKEYRVDRAPRIMGFMAEKRMREAKAKGRA